MPVFELNTTLALWSCLLLAYFWARKWRLRWNRRGTRIEIAAVALTMLGALVLKGWV